ncbi:MAG: hypothetical protein K1X75_05795 [Leptospirales bacterium]|nr:hypothetical protein [Leptospirales bacterium]
MIRKAMIAALLATAGWGFGCESAAPIDDQGGGSLSVSEELDRIRQNYTPPPCLYATFRIKAQAPGQSAQSARGVLRADNQNHRMLLILRDPYIGITLSRIVVRDTEVFYSNPRSDLQTAPLEAFRVSGMGYNQVALPFSVFQDLLFARLPEEAFGPRRRVARDAEGVSIALQRNGDDFNYRFVAQRLSRINYIAGGGGVEVQAAMNGRYRDTAYPASIRLESGPRGLPPEVLEVSFDSINTAAECRESQFSPR